jgi:predicted alpha/beta hydrolase family esterase
MVAKGLRRGLAVQAIGMAICAYLLVRFIELSLAAAAALSFAVLLGVYLLFTLATFAICWPRSRDGGRGQTIGLFAACRTIFTEWLAIFALFGVIQPFADNLFSVKGRSRRAEKLPVLLVHGYRCNSGLWWWMIPKLRTAGFVVEALDLEPALASIDRFAEQLHHAIEAYLQETGSLKLRLVTHSMGGLVARAYLKRYGGQRVDKVITLACGHHGTRIAYFGLGKNAREMEPGSAWLAALPEPAPVPVVTVWTAQDNFIAPQTSSRLSDAQDIIVTGMGHLTLVFSRLVLDIVTKELG